MSSILSFNFCRKWTGRKIILALTFLVGVILFSDRNPALQAETLLAAGEGTIDDTGEIVHDIRSKKSQNEESLNNLALKYGLVQNRSVNASLKISAFD